MYYVYYFYHYHYPYHLHFYYQLPALPLDDDYYMYYVYFFYHYRYPYHLYFYYQLPALPLRKATAAASAAAAPVAVSVAGAAAAIAAVSTELPFQSILRSTAAPRAGHTGACHCHGATIRPLTDTEEVAARALCRTGINKGTPQSQAASSIMAESPWHPS